MTVAPIPSRFGFVAAGRSAFDFVMGPPYSMWLTEQDEGRVGYEGHDVMLALLHDLMSYELDIALWRPSVEDEVRHPFKIADMIRVSDPEKARAYRCFSAASEDSVRRGVTMLASDFRHYGIAALVGDTTFYQKMSAARSEVVRQFGISLVDETARKKAEQAWRRQDFQAVVKSYRSMEDRLSRVEQARLNYAIRRLRE
jgi:hypothetical protein